MMKPIQYQFHQDQLAQSYRKQVHAKMHNLPQSWVDRIRADPTGFERWLADLSMAKKKTKYTKINAGQVRGWSGGAKVLCILHHRGVQLILAYSWARPAILIVGKGRGGMFLFLLFLHFHSCSSFFPVPLFHLLYSLFYLFSPFLWETTQNDPQGLTCR